jgi:NADH-quinone oxidoreductase subunit N
MNFSLTLTDFSAISPLLILLVAALVLLLMESFSEEIAKKFAFLTTVTAIVAALCASFYAPITDQALLTRWLRFDQFARFFTIFFLVIGLGTALISTAFFQRFAATQGEYYFLLLSSLFGLILIGGSADFLTLFLGLETLSISLYVLCGYMKKWGISHEAAIKYFLMGALAAAFLLYGIALIYGATGTTQFDALLAKYEAINEFSNKTLFMSGIALVTLGLAFKAAVVPFHVWAPDVYDGAPTPITAFMSVGTKTGAFVAFIRIFMETLLKFNPIWNQGIALLAYLTIIYANIVAIRQEQLRRFFAYSGVSHAGFLLIPLAASSSIGALPALLFYLIIYAIATLGAFAVLTFLDRNSDGVLIRDLRGLFYRSPWLASIFALCLLTLAGIPPTAGFLAKFYLFKVAFEAGFYGLVIVGLLMTVIAAYYYLRIIAIMFAEFPVESQTFLKCWPATVVGAISFVSIIVLSFYPMPVISLVSLLR